MNQPEPKQVALPDDVIALVPMRNVVLFPHVLMPISVGRAKSIAAVLHALHAGAAIGIVLQRDARVDDPGRDALCDIGTIAKVVQHVESSEQLRHAVCHGVQRFRIEALVEGYPFLAARVQRIDEPHDVSTQAEALGLQLRERAVEILSLLPGVPAELAHALQATRAPSQLADIVASLIDAEVAEKQMLLETLNTEERLQKVLAILSRRIEVLRLSQEIGERTKEQLDDRQRKFLLREQLKTIQKELGEDDESDEDVARLDELIAKAGMPAEVEAQARKEMARLKRMSEASGEYVDAAHLPRVDDRAALGDAAGDADRPEGRARRCWRPTTTGSSASSSASSSTSRCRSSTRRAGRRSCASSARPASARPRSARASPGRSGRPFVRVSLGGVHDEAEIRGHRRTYIGAMPGIIVQSLRKAGARHCVMMLDEVDKLSASAHGDPSAALLEVLDPEQNSTFRDNYLGVPFDLSRVVFIATANVIDNVPPPVRDRMEVIELPGYTQEEKLQIAQRYLLKRQRETNGLRDEQCELTADALRAIVADYTREAGVRQLEREIGRVMRHVAMKVAEGAAASVRVDAADLDAILGPAEVRARGRDAQQRARRGDRAGLDAGGRRHPVHRGDARRRQRQADPDRSARRRDEGERAGGADAGEVARARAASSGRHVRRTSTSTSTCRPARSRRTDRAPAWRCSSHWLRCSPSARCATTWR